MRIWRWEDAGKNGPFTNISDEDLGEEWFDPGGPYEMPSVQSEMDNFPEHREKHGVNPYFRKYFGMPRAGFESREQQRMWIPESMWGEILAFHGQRLVVLECDEEYVIRLREQVVFDRSKATIVEVLYS